MLEQNINALAHKHDVIKVKCDNLVNSIHKVMQRNFIYIYLRIEKSMREVLQEYITVRAEQASIEEYLGQISIAKIAHKYQLQSPASS